MRKRITLDQDVAELVKQQMRRTGRGFNAVVNDGLRHGLGAARRQATAKHFRVQAHAFGFRPGIDPEGINKLVDALEVSEDESRL